MYVYYLLGLGGWVGAPEEDTAPPPAEAPRAHQRPHAEPRPACPGRRAAHPGCWKRASGLRA